MPAGRKPGPPGSATDRNKRAHPWKQPAGVGWQYGRKPNPPAGLTEAGKKAWRTWFGSWWAGFWSPDDLPGLELTVRKFDMVLMGALDVSKVVPLLDKYGITPAGRQALRWAPPEQPAEPAKQSTGGKAEDEFAKKRRERQERLGKTGS